MHNNLTHRQLQVLKAVASGLTQKAAASAIGISYATYQKHIALLYKRMGFECNIQAVHYALHHNLVSNMFSKPKESNDTRTIK